MPKKIKPLIKGFQNLPDCGHGKEKLVVNRCNGLWVALFCFGSLSFVVRLWLRVVANCSTAERFKYLFFPAIKIHTMVRIVKKRNNFIFSSLGT